MAESVFDVADLDRVIYPDWVKSVSDATQLKPEAALKILQAHVAQLSEHFEAVQILASYPLEGGTHPIMVGSGNWFARIGMARVFADKDQAMEIGQQIAEALSE